MTEEEHATKAQIFEHLKWGGLTVAEEDLHDAVGENTLLGVLEDMEREAGAKLRMTKRVRSEVVIEWAEPYYSKPKKRNLESQVWQRDGNHCVRCTREVFPFKVALARQRDCDRKNMDRSNIGVIDHIVRRADGGTSDLDNLRLLCWTCNSSIARWSDR